MNGIARLLLTVLIIAVVLMVATFIYSTYLANIQVPLDTLTTTLQSQIRETLETLLTWRNAL